jgi:hypothetical protein
MKGANGAIHTSMGRSPMLPAFIEGRGLKGRPNSSTAIISKTANHLLNHASNQPERRTTVSIPARTFAALTHIHEKPRRCATRAVPRPRILSKENHHEAILGKH